MSFHIGDLHSLLELEIDERLDVARLNLNDDEDEDDDEDGLDHQRTTGNEVLCLVGDKLGHEVEHIAKKHEEGNGFVGGKPLEEYLRLELVPYLIEHLFGNAEGGSTEEHPQGCDEMEGHHSTDHHHKPIFRWIGIALAWQVGEWAEHTAKGVPDFVEAEEDAVEATLAQRLENAADQMEKAAESAKTRKAEQEKLQKKNYNTHNMTK